MNPSPSTPTRAAVLGLPCFPVARLLEPEANNLDLIRLICACLVIYGHAFVIAPDPAWPALTWDPSLRLGYAGVYCGSLAVKVFFFISGLLVTNSLLVKKSPSHYVIARFFRIWPALTVLLLVSAFAIGPALTSLETREYFSHFSVYHYVIGNLLMWLPEQLPGMFADNPLPSLVNGSLWTLSYEVTAYFLLLLTTVLGLFRHRVLGGLVLLLVVIDPLLPHPLLSRWLGPNPQFIYLPSCFAFGALLALYKDRLVISPVLLGLVITAFCALHGTRFGPLLCFTVLFLLLFYFSGLSWVRKIRLKADMSYGTFLWGFLLQQIVAEKFDDRGFALNLGLSLTAALFLGFLSWHLIERPAIRLGRHLSDQWKGRFPARPPGVRFRLMLAGLLIALFFAWRLTRDDLQSYAARQDRPAKESTAAAYESVDVAPPDSSSFPKPDLKKLNDENVVMLLPPARMAWTIDPSVRAVSFAYGFEPIAYERGDTDGADVFLELSDGAGTRPLFHRFLDPIRQPADRGPQTAVVVLPPLARGTSLVLRTGPGPAGNNAWDWAYLSHLRLRKEAVFARQQFPGFDRVPDEIKGSQIGVLQDEDGKPFLFIAAPSSLTFSLRRNDHELKVAYGFARTAYSTGGHTNGAILRIEIQSRYGQVRRLFEYYAKPVERVADRPLLQATVILPPPKAGDRLVVHLLPGDNNDASWDHTFIRQLSLR